MGIRRRVAEDRRGQGQGEGEEGYIHKESAKKSEARNEQRFPLSRERESGDGTYREGNSGYSRSLPPLVNHCNIRAGEYVVTHPRPSSPGHIRTSIQSARETFRVPKRSDPPTLRNSIETIAADRTARSRNGACCRLKKRNGKEEGEREDKSRKDAQRKS